MNNYSLVQPIMKISCEISKTIFKEIPEDKKKKIELHHTTPFKDIWSKVCNIEDYQGGALILGLNPSSEDIDAKNEQSPCFLQYVPEYWFTDPEDKIAITAFGKKNKYTYNTYFKRPYELFLNSFSPLWTNESYLEINFKNYKLNEDEFKVLKDINNQGENKGFIIVCDLLYFKAKDSKIIKSVIDKEKKVNNKNNGLIKNINELLKLQIELFKPEICFVNNAYASKYIMELLIEEENLKQKIFTSIKSKKYNTTFVFSSMASNGALDNFGYERLKKEIGEILNNNP